MSQEHKNADVTVNVNTDEQAQYTQKSEHLINQEEGRVVSEKPANSQQEEVVSENLAGQEEAEIVSENLHSQQEAELPLVDHDALGTLPGELEQALAKAEENWKLYLSARAELENIRKRGERELQNARKFALKEFIDALLPVKDSLEMGVAAANEIVDVNKLREGSELTLKMLSKAFEQYGVQEVNPLGVKFNPELHEAMAMQPSEHAEPNTVLQVIQKGYVLNERLIRPAMVIVAQAVQKRDSETPLG
jgi:molecular chaperone GrpE